MRGRPEFEDTFRRVLHAALARLGTTGVFTELVGEIGGREVVRLASEAFSAKEVRRWLDEPDDGATAPLPDWVRAEMAAIAAAGKVAIVPDELHSELGSIAARDRWARDREVKGWTDTLIVEYLSPLFTHLSGSDKVGRETGPRVRFIAQCLRYLNPAVDELIGPVEVEVIKTPHKIRKLLMKHG